MTPMHLRLSRSPAAADARGVWLALAARDAALLAWLALEGPTARNRLAALLWPDSPPEAARNALRQRLFKLRQQHGRALVDGAGVLALAEGLAHDLHEPGELLADLAGLPEGEFALWLAHRRAQRLAQRQQALAAQAEAAEQAGDWPGALEAARAALALEPLAEPAHRRLMRLHYLAGDRAAALRAFEQCAELLARELGTRPDAQTLALRDTVAQAAPAAPPPGALRSVPAAVLRPPRLVGRERERARLHEAWAQGRSVVLGGEGGLGKTRLALDFAADIAGAAAGRNAVLLAGARPGDAGVVYASASRLLRQLPRAALDTLEAPLRGELARLLPELGEAPPLRTPAERTRFFNAAATALDQRRLGLHGIVLDDLHHADAASLELLQYVAGAAPGRWLLCARQAELGPAARGWLAALGEGGEAEAIELEPLSLAQVEELLESLGIEALRGPAAAAALRRRSGGNPLYLLESVKAWLQAGAAEGAALPAGRNATALIGRRIGQLSERAVQLARCAAVATPDFSIELAAHVLGLRTLELADPWAELEAAQVLADGAFAHDLIHEAALASVPAPVARRLHAEVAEFLALRGGEPARLARHWDSAGRPEAAARAWLDAAERARGAGRAADHAALLAEAAQCFARAGDAPARFDALLQRAGVLAGNDSGAPAQAAAAELAALASAPLERLQALGVQLELAITRFEIDAALALAPQAVEAARALGRRDLEWRFAIAWSGALGDARRTAEGVAVLEPYREAIERDGDAEQRWTFWEAYALALDYDNRLRDAARGWQACQALAREAARPDWLWRSLSNAAAGLAKTGRVREACELSAQARQVALAGTEVGRLRLLQMQAPHAHRLRDIGHYDRALPLLEEVLAGFREQGSASDLTMAEQRLALLFMQLGQPARAVPLLATVREGVPPGVAMFHRVLQAELARLLGGDALAPMREALARLPNPDDVFHRIATLFATAVVPAEEAEALAVSLAAWAARKERFGLALSGHVRAAAAALAQGAAARALPHAEAALELAREHQPESFYLGELWLVAARVQQALARSQEARRLAADGRAWVMALHDAHVPPAFRASFLARNPVNRALLAL